MLPFLTILFPSLDVAAQDHLYLILNYFNSSRLSFNYVDLYNIAKHFDFKLQYRDDIHQGLIDNTLETIMVILVMRNLQFDTI